MARSRHASKATQLTPQERGRQPISLGRTALAELWRHPLHTREVGAQLTNVLRCLRLESEGYRVTVTELVGWEHSLKNELIIATYNPQCRMSDKQRASNRLNELLQSFGLESLRDRFAPAIVQS